MVYGTTGDGADGAGLLPARLAAPLFAQLDDGILRQQAGRQSSVLCSPLQGGVLLNVLPVLVQGGGADALQLATGQGGLQDVGSVDGTLGGTGTDQGVHLVDHLHRGGAGRQYSALCLRGLPAAGWLAWL